jgi:excisionase family DNA binding protein
MESQSEKEWLSPSEVASMLNLGMTRTYELLRSEITVVRLGRIIRVRRQDIETWILAHKVTPKD